MLVSFRMSVFDLMNVIIGMIGDADVVTHTHLYHAHQRLNHKLLVPGLTQNLFLFCGDICFVMRSWAT